MSKKIYIFKIIKYHIQIQLQHNYRNLMKKNIKKNNNTEEEYTTLKQLCINVPNQNYQN